MQLSYGSTSEEIVMVNGAKGKVWVRIILFIL